MGFTAVASIVAGSQVTAAVALAAIAEVGVALTVVGAVTGSKDLTKLGATMGLVGSVGGLIANTAAGSAALGEAVAGTGTTVFDDVAANAANEAALQQAVGAGTETAVKSATDEALGGLAGQAGETATSAIGGGLPGTAPSQVTTTAAPTTAVQQPSVIQPDATSVAGAQAPTGPTSPASVDVNAVNTPAGSTGAQSGSSFLDSFNTFASKNKDLLNVGMKLGGSALQGLQSASQWDEKLALEKQRMANANSVGNFAPTTTPVTGSIIQQARAAA